MKESFYFPHDCNSIQDPKMMELLSTCGLSGVGIYWILIEILHQQSDGRISEESFKKYIKFYCSFETSGEHMLNKIEQQLIKCKLLSKEDGFIFSKRVIQNKEERKKLKEKRSYAGKKSAESRAKSTSVEHMLNKAQQGKEKKRKEKKENNINSGEKISPTPAQQARKFFTSLEQQQKITEELIANGCNPDIARNEVDKFIDYWTELNKSGSKQRWEMQKTFSVNLRLKTWFRNFEKFNPQITKRYVA